MVLLLYWEICGVSMPPAALSAVLRAKGAAVYTPLNALRYGEAVEPMDILRFIGQSPASS
jgi:hypothetical protein